MANEIVIREWVDALRSGDFKQVEGKLAKQTDGGTGYCCLGVLCEIAVKHEVIEPPVNAVDGFGDEHPWFAYGKDNDADELPDEVKEWAGLPSSNPEVEYTLTEEEREDYYGEARYVDDDEDEAEVIEVPEDAPTTSVETLADLNDTHGRSFGDIADAIEAKFLGGKS